jgi:hypothetical protein
MIILNLYKSEFYIKKALLYLVCMYGSFSLTRWIPYLLDYNEIILIRYSILISISLVLLVNFYLKRMIPVKNTLILLSFSLIYLLLNFSAFINGEERASFVMIRDLVYLCILLFAIISISDWNLDDYLKIFLITFSILSLFHILGTFQILDFKHPLNGKNIGTSGFNELSTEWSSSITCVATMFFILKRKNLLYQSSFTLIYASQLLVNGRAGIVATTIGIIFYSFNRKEFKNLFYLLIIPAIFIIRPVEKLDRYQEFIFFDSKKIISIDAKEVNERTDFYQVLNSIECNEECKKFIIELDRISTYRIQQYILGIRNFINKPFGYGFGKAAIYLEEQNQKYHIHNVYIRMANEGGVTSLTFCLIIIIMPFILFASEYKWYFLIASIPALFEPRFIYNAAVDQSAPWWLLFFVLLGKYIEKRYHSQK